MYAWSALFLHFFIILINLFVVKSELCDKCLCYPDSNKKTYNIHCNDMDIDQNMLSEWPQFDEISASFHQNNFSTLKQFPLSNATIELILSSCAIQYLDDDLFQNIINVRYVDLSHNLITGEELRASKFRGPINLNTSQLDYLGIQHLDLSYNQIHSLSNKLFQAMPQLKTLNLEGNQFRVLDYQTQLAISSISTLERLYLGNNQLTELVSDAIAKLTKLNEIDLSNNLLDFVPANSLIHVGNSLQVLILDGNPIFEIDDKTFIGLNNLTMLSLNRLGDLKYISGNAFVPLAKLEKLHICDNPLLTDIDREAFRSNFSLRELYLSNNNLYKIDYKLLFWPNLKVLNISDNPFECSCDLYNITKSLRSDIARIENGPYCFNPSTDQSEQVYNLKSDICSAKRTNRIFTKQLRAYHHLSIAMTGLILILVFASALAMHLAFHRYRITMQNRSVGIGSEINYNPLRQNALF